jgi:hypothetical protein
MLIQYYLYREETRLKFKSSLIIIFFILILLIAVACNKKQDEKSNVNIIKGKIYNEVIERGLQQEGASINDLLYEELLGENKIVFFTAYNAIGVGFMIKNKEEWVWNRNTPLYDFQCTSKPMPSYMAGGAEIEAPDGKKLFLAMGKIFNSDITKLTLSEKEISVVIKEKDGNRFWFKLLNNKNLINRIMQIYKISS